MRGVKESERTSKGKVRTDGGLGRDDECGDGVKMEGQSAEECLPKKKKREGW